MLCCSMKFEDVILNELSCVVLSAGRLFCVACSCGDREHSLCEYHRLVSRFKPLAIGVVRLNLSLELNPRHTPK